MNIIDTPKKSLGGGDSLNVSNVQSYLLSPSNIVKRIFMITPILNCYKNKYSFIDYFTFRNDIITCYFVNVSHLNNENLFILWEIEWNDLSNEILNDNRLSNYKINIIVNT